MLERIPWNVIGLAMCSEVPVILQMSSKVLLRWASSTRSSLDGALFLLRIISAILRFIFIPLGQNQNFKGKTYNLFYTVQATLPLLSEVKHGQDRIHHYLFLSFSDYKPEICILDLPYLEGSPCKLCLAMTL